MQPARSFIGLKPGLLTGKARMWLCLYYHHALGLESWLAAQTVPARRFDASQLADWLPPRRPTSHKGDHGKLVIIGGDRGTAGAIRMAGEAALRAGRVWCECSLTKKTLPYRRRQPELMVHELTTQSVDSLQWADVVVGPGLDKTNGEPSRCVRCGIAASRW